MYIRFFYSLDGPHTNELARIVFNFCLIARNFMLTIMHFAELPLYEYDLLKLYQVPRSFYASPNYDGCLTNNTL
jgi:hypothetical protein